MVKAFKFISECAILLVLFTLYIIVFGADDTDVFSHLFFYGIIGYY